MLKGADIKPLVVVEPARSAFRVGLPTTASQFRLVSLLVWRDLRVRYADTALGVSWVIVQPVLLLLVFHIVFGRIVSVPSDGVPYPVFAFTALLPWTYISQAMSRSGVSLLTDAQLIRKVYFPRLVLPLSASIGPLADFAVSSVVLVAMMMWYRLVPSPRILALPIFLGFAILAALAGGIWLAALSARYRDVRHLIPLIVQVWLYASPIVYPASLVPERWRVLYDLNPATVIVEGFRWALLDRNLPHLGAATASVLLVAVVLMSGLVYFRNTERTLADVL